NAYHKLKKKVKDIATLRIPNLTDPFVVDTDACQYGVGAVLLQQSQGELHPVAYASTAFTQRARNWPPRECEAFAVCFALMHWRDYLIPQHFTVRTDHHSLQWLMKADKGKLARWATLISEFNFTLQYRSGPQMQHADFLSRIYEPDRLEEELVILPLII